MITIFACEDLYRLVFAEWLHTERVSTLRKIIFKDYPAINSTYIHQRRYFNFLSQVHSHYSKCFSARFKNTKKLENMQRFEQVL